ncbi:MAG: hypothetical protein J7K26_04025 [Candidatus Aenigmarchaeota archaeon]|nr:hypothetical protein [Candidatus Aenigmarchaeota archaeon]
MHINEQYIIENILKSLKKQVNTLVPEKMLIEYFMNRNNYDDNGRVIDVYKNEAKVLIEAFDFNMYRGYRTNENGEKYIGKQLGLISNIIFNSGLNETEIINKAIDEIENYLIELEEKNKGDMLYYPQGDEVATN